MIRRTRWALLVLPLLALTAGCTDVVGDFKEWLAPSGPTGGTANAPSANAGGGAIESPSVLQNAQVVGVSSRTTPGQVWAEPVVADEEVSIPLPVTALGDHFYFEVPSPSGPMEFIGYQLDGELQIRASVCPNCGVPHIDYGAGVLECPTCGSTFDLRTGAAITGSQGYPQGSIGYFLADGYLKSPLHTLTVAYERTVSGEESLYKAPSTPDPGRTVTRHGGCSG